MFLVRSLALFLALLGASQPTSAYSVLTHESIIDLTWAGSIQPLLLHRFPKLTPIELRVAHAYAYGGCVIQDLGYYPFGQPSFSDLLHYVRTGDFIRALFRDSKNANDVAFAVGALSHYLGDTIGHPEAINIAVGKEFPELAAEFGNNVNYAEGEHQHVRAEFAFDINNITQERIAPEKYLNRIGFAIPVPLLAKAFYETYGLDIADILHKHRPQLKGYRFAVRTLLPRVAYAEVLLHGKNMHADPPSPEIDELNRQVAALAAADNWNSYRRHPGFGTHLLAGLIVIIPKVGPLSDLSIRGPRPDTEIGYVKSLLHTTAVMRDKLAHATTQDGLANLDLDTGDLIRPGSYVLCDNTWAELLHKVTRTPATPVPFGIKRDIEAYFADPPKARFLTAKHVTQVAVDLPILRTISTKAQYPDTAFLPEPEADLAPDEQKQPQAPAVNPIP
ncbi:MAG: zinc dependent phospholipase C family protein [Acidobacteriota bacterium]|nr:zinc dependent phospholipase C family protein [Acidobacteriota bacterium]